MGFLNPKQVENLIEPGTYEDGDGFRLIVKSTGRKSWLLRFQLDGRRREMGLGAYPEISLKNARIEANSKRRQLIDGVDPLAARDLAGSSADFRTLNQKHLSERHTPEWTVERLSTPATGLLSLLPRSSGKAGFLTTSWLYPEPSPFYLKLTVLG